MRANTPLLERLSVGCLHYICDKLWQGLPINLKVINLNQVPFSKGIILMIFMLFIQ